MRFPVSDCFHLENSYRLRTWGKPGVVEEITDIFRFFMLEGTIEGFQAAASQMRKPDLRSRWRGFWQEMPLVPYAAVWRDGSICMELEVGAVRLQNNLSLLFFGEREQVRRGDQIELLSIEPRRQEISTREAFFTKRNKLPIGALWATDWIKVR